MMQTESAKPPPNPNFKGRKPASISMLRKASQMQHRIYEAAMKANGRDLCALASAFERLEILKRAMRGLPSPDALARAGKLSELTPKKRALKSTPFPEPIEPDEPGADRPTTDDRPKSGPEDDREGIYFGMEG